MDAAAEADVSGIAAADVEPVGVVESPRVALGRTEQHRHLLADLHLLARDDDAGFEDPPFEQLQGRIPAQHLLDCRPRLDLAPHESPPLVRMLQQRPHTVAERVDGRLVTRLHEHHRGRHDLVLGEHVALIFDADELGNE